MKLHFVSMLTVTLLSVAVAAPVAWADGRNEGRSEKHQAKKQKELRGWGGKRDIRRFETHHHSVWRSGRWHHGWHKGRFGWWWIAAGIWYFYPVPVYPYPNPYVPPAVAAPPAGTWYYCEASKNYYPYVPTCPGGWKAVPATPPDAPANIPPPPPAK